MAHKDKIRNQITTSCCWATSYLLVASLLLIVCSACLAESGSVVSYSNVPSPGVKGRAAPSFFSLQNLSIYRNPADESEGIRPFAKIEDGSFYIDDKLVCKMDFAGLCSQEFHLETYSSSEASWWVPYFEQRRVDERWWYLIKLRGTEGWVSEGDFPDAKSVQDILKSDHPKAFTRALNTLEIYVELTHTPKFITADYRRMCHRYDLPKGEKHRLDVIDFVEHNGEKFVKVQYDIYVCDGSGKNPERLYGKGVVKLSGSDNRPNVWEDHSTE